VILGSYEGATSPVRATRGMNYLLVTLRDGEAWTYTPPPGQLVGWLAVSHGALDVDGPVTAGELAVFAADGAPIHVVAAGETRFVLGTSVPHPHDLVTGMYSVHTNAASLARGERRIRELRPVRLAS
jgi:redox-sensitive bicupin YhaK (pirin superfamily)